MAGTCGTNVLSIAGYKLFYRQDVPLMSPEDVLGLEPAPDVVIYQ